VCIAGWWMAARKPQLQKIFSSTAPSQSITAFMLPVYEEPDDVDGQEGVVKPGVVQCIALHHPDRKDGKAKDAPFIVSCPQGLQNFDAHLKAHHGVYFKVNDQPTVAQAFAGQKTKAKAVFLLTERGNKPLLVCSPKKWNVQKLQDALFLHLRPWSDVAPQAKKNTISKKCNIVQYWPLSKVQYAISTTSHIASSTTGEPRSTQKLTQNHGFIIGRFSFKSGRFSLQNPNPCRPQCS
jgi:hypothetical protein